jgi:ligand-binding sensor domain-containing protein
MNKSFVAILILFGILFSGNAQEKSIYFQHITPKEGLSQGYILCMLQDREGYIWIGTFYGLNRYNGYTFKLFTNSKTDTTSLTSNTILSLFEDKEGFIWVGTEYGLDRFDKKTETFKHYRVKTGNNCLNDGYILAISQDTEENIWVATKNGGLNRIDHKTGRITYIKNKLYPKQSSNTINDLCFCRDNKLWIATDGDGLCYLSPGENKIIPFPQIINGKDAYPIRKVRCLYYDAAGILWFGDSEGRIFSTDIKNNRLIQHHFLPFGIKPEYYVITDITGDSEGNLLIGTNGAGLIIYNHCCPIKIY